MLELEEHSEAAEQLAIVSEWLKPFTSKRVASKESFKRQTPRCNGAESSAVKGHTKLD